MYLSIYLIKQLIVNKMHLVSNKTASKVTESYENEEKKKKKKKKSL